ncbi:TerC family protein [Longispora urticae]
MSAEIILGFLSLLLLELVLGIDNVVFISILAGKLPVQQQEKARRIGLGLALIMRIGLLFALSWVIGLTAPLFDVYGHEISGRDLILILGGLFLIGKASHEIHGGLEGSEGGSTARAVASFGVVVTQIVLLDVVFSLDSVITAVGMVDELSVMIAAVVVAMLITLVLSGPLSRFVHRHPSIKMLALAFLLLIGAMLLVDGFDRKIPKGYIYCAMAFALAVELLNIRARAARSRRRDFPSGAELSTLLVVADLDASIRFYRDTLGATLVREYGGTSSVLSFEGAWLLLVTGGGPTPDKPGVTFAPPADPDRVDHELTLKVPDCRAAHRLLTGRGVDFLTDPVESEWEVRCFFRDPDGRLIEISESR